MLRSLGNRLRSAWFGFISFLGIWNFGAAGASSEKWVDDLDRSPPKEREETSDAAIEYVCVQQHGAAHWQDQDNGSNSGEYLCQVWHRRRGIDLTNVLFGGSDLPVDEQAYPTIVPSTYKLEGFGGELALSFCEYPRCRFLRLLKNRIEQLRRATATT